MIAPTNTGASWIRSQTYLLSNYDLETVETMIKRSMDNVGVEGDIPFNGELYDGQWDQSNTPILETRTFAGSVVDYQPGPTGMVRLGFGEWDEDDKEWEATRRFDLFANEYNFMFVDTNTTATNPNAATTPLEVRTTTRTMNRRAFEEIKKTQRRKFDICDCHLRRSK